MKKTNLLLLNFIFLCIFSYGQTIIYDFETGSPSIVTRYGSVATIEANTNTIGNALKVGRTTSNWWEVVAFDLPSSISIPATEKRYLHVLVNYPAQPDISIRFDSPSAAS